MSRIVPEGYQLQVFVIETGACAGIAKAGERYASKEDWWDQYGARWTKDGVEVGAPDIWEDTTLEWDMVGALLEARSEAGPEVRSTERAV